MVVSKALLWKAAPLAAMILVECGEVVMTTLTKAAMDKGISNYVYAVYYNCLGVLILLPNFIFHVIRKKSLPITSSLIYRCFLLGLLGRCLLMITYLGIDYSSPAMTAALGNLTPVFTFLIALIFRMEKLDIRSRSSQAKSLGTIITVSGAFVVTLYKGPVLLFKENISGNSISTGSNMMLLASEQSKWILGGLYLALGYLFLSTWGVLQAQTVKKYPDKTTVVFLFMLFGSIQCAIFSFMVERNSNAWILHHKVEKIAIFYSAIFGTAIRYTVLTWCLKEKGPLYVALFKPFGMVIAEISGIFFLGDTLHLGSLIGAVTITLGFYTVTWGNAKEEKQIEMESTDQHTTPLLQNNNSKCDQRV